VALTKILGAYMEMKVDPAKGVVRFAIAAIFAALVCVVTLVLVVNIPATNGYFNIGETMIYIAALLFGPLVGAFAGGVGAAISDLLVAPVYAPATLIVKSCEGAIVGFLNKKMPKQTSAGNWRVYTVALGMFLGILFAAIGAFYLQNVDVYLGFPQPAIPTFSISIPAWIWCFLGAALALAIALMGFKLEPDSGRAVLSILAGGLEMVLGYFLYEQLVLGKTAAVVEVAANILQMIIGLAVAIPVARTVSRRLPQFRK
jgi:uncharacterized membrane protein